MVKYHGVLKQVNHDIPQFTIQCHGIPCNTMVYHGISWYIMVYHGIFS